MTDTVLDRSNTSRSDSTSADMPDRGDGAKRAVIGTIALIGLISAIGLLGRLIFFDRAGGAAEERFLRWIADRRIGALDTAATIGSALSDTRTVVGVIVGSVAMLWASGYRRHGVTVALAVCVEFATFLSVGQIVGRPRPDVEALDSVPSTPSFPSGHVAAAVVLYGALVLVARSIDARRVPSWAWAAPVAAGLAGVFARLYEGVHNPTDVAAGLLVGVGALCVAGLSTGILTRDGRSLRVVRSGPASRRPPTEPTRDART